MQIFSSLAYMVMSLWGGTPAPDSLTFPPSLAKKEQIRYVMDSWVKEEDKNMVMPEELSEVICMYVLADYNSLICLQAYPTLFKPYCGATSPITGMALHTKTEHFALFFRHWFGVYSLKEEEYGKQRIFTTVAGEPLMSACFDAQGGVVAMGGRGGNISIGDADLSKKLKHESYCVIPIHRFAGHKGHPVKSICFVNQGSCFVSTCTQKTCVWSYDQRISEIFSLPKSYEGVYPNPYNPIIACRSFDKLSFIDIRFCQPVLVPIKKRAGVMDFAFSPIGGKMAVAGRDGLDIYDLRFLDKKNFFKQLSSDLNFTIDYSADGVLGAISVEQNTIRLYDGDTIRKIDTGHDCDDFGFVGSDIVVRGSTGVNVFSPLS